MRFKNYIVSISSFDFRFRVPVSSFDFEFRLLISTFDFRFGIHKKVLILNGNNKKYLKKISRNIFWEISGTKGDGTGTGCPGQQNIFLCGTGQGRKLKKINGTGHLHPWNLLYFFLTHDYSFGTLLINNRTYFRRGTHKEGLLEKLTEMNTKLEEIQKSLDMYLETKRQIFPRFYFLSNDDLLEILGQSKNPPAVQPHMNKCFDNIKGRVLKKLTKNGNFVENWNFSRKMKISEKCRPKIFFFLQIFFSNLGKNEISKSICAKFDCLKSV